MKTPLLECIPNISEGRSEHILEKIKNIIESRNGVYLLHMDANPDANRSVFTIVGSPDAVFLSMEDVYAFCAENIDMRYHRGIHPRIGAIDVCPFVALSGIQNEELIPMVKDFAEKITEDLQIPGYLYELSALSEKRANLAHIRSGEYEKFAEKMIEEPWLADVGPTVFNAKFGATVIGVRNFLLAYNVNLNTVDDTIAHKIAQRIRTSGQRVGDKRQPGILKGVKAIGWYMEAYGFAQVSTNIVDTHQSSLADVYTTVNKIGQEYNVKATGSELIGMVPLDAMLKAGEAFSSSMDESELIKQAINGLGLDQLKDFNPSERIIEYKIRKILDGR